MNIVDRARMIATAAHEGQRRKYTGEPYINHPERVAVMIETFTAATPQTTNEVIAAALLHDVVEDTSITIDAIEQAFGPFVRSLVDQLTKPNEPLTYVAKSIKACDLIDNLSDLVEVAPPGEALAYLIMKAQQVLDICEAIRPYSRPLAERLASTWKRQWDSLPA